MLLTCLDDEDGDVTEYTYSNITLFGSWQVTKYPPWQVTLGGVMVCKLASKLISNVFESLWVSYSYILVP